jgi:hypothetical protein
MKAALLLMVIAVLCTTFKVSAQTIQTDIPTLSKGADVIVTGKVTNQKSDWNPGKTSIYTRVTLQVDDVLKGNGAQSTITVVHPGGEIDGVGELYTHIPKFNTNEEVLLFAKKKDNSSDYIVYEGELGKMTLYKDNTGELVTAQRTKVASLKDEIKKILSAK